jgi:hypothetical protein
MSFPRSLRGEGVVWITKASDGGLAVDLLDVAEDPQHIPLVIPGWQDCRRIHIRVDRRCDARVEILGLGGCRRGGRSRECDCGATEKSGH